MTLVEVLVEESVPEEDEVLPVLEVVPVALVLRRLAPVLEPPPPQAVRTTPEAKSITRRGGAVFMVFPMC
jgi:hypothetical protein